jgi:nitrogen-specific signal transduction histidine kinase/ActR/RegA family two-component response regulator
VRAFGTSQDITELKQAEEDKKSLEVKLRRTQRLETIGTMAGGIAHDFNNILTPILGYADMAMLSVEHNEVAREDLQRVIKAANRAKNLVQQILAFSRQGEQDHKPAELQQIVTEALEMLRASVPSAIEVHRKFNASRIHVLADPSQLHQVVMNLCTNAIHAMRGKGGVLTVALEADAGSATKRHRKQPGQCVRLAVSDTGCGMDKETMERIFEPFFTTKAVGEGTGLGLSMAHGIVTQHGGEIIAESEPGKGSTFTIYLPMLTTDVAIPEDVPEDVPRGSEHILMVDDEEEITSVMQKLLERQGYTVTAMNDPRKALALFSSAPKEFDLAVLDQTMPGLAGAELASELLALRDDMPVLLVTGYNDAMPDAAAASPGIREFLHKPVSSRELGEAIRRHIGKTQTTEVWTHGANSGH